MLSKRKRDEVVYALPAIAGRVPPHNLDAEAAVLSSILLDSEALDRVVDTLKPEHFYSDANRRVYEVSVDLYQSGSSIDIVSVANGLRTREWLNQIGGASYLAQLADKTPFVANLEDHAKIVYDAWRARKMIEAGHRITAEGYAADVPVAEYLERSEQTVFAVSHGASTAKQPRRLYEIMVDDARAIQAACEDWRGVTGLSTGFADIDNMITGLHDGDVYIIAGRPGQGKTALAMDMAVNAASDNGVGPSLVGVFVQSLEMPEEQLSRRLACSRAKVDLKKLRSGRMMPADWSAHAEASAFLAPLPIWIDDTPAVTLLTLRAKLRRVKATWERPKADGKARRLGLAVVDYLQLMRGDGTAKNREQEIAEISRGLKQMAKEFKMPVIALSQLNRGTETRSAKDKRPQLADLRESGAIEQDADAVLMLYRDEYYDPNTKHKGVAEVIIPKQRNGPTGKVYIKFTAHCTRFDNLAAEDRPAGADDE